MRLLSPVKGILALNPLLGCLAGGHASAAPPSLCKVVDPQRSVHDLNLGLGGYHSNTAASAPGQRTLDTARVAWGFGFGQGYLPGLNFSSLNCG